MRSLVCRHNWKPDQKQKIVADSRDVYRQIKAQAERYKLTEGQQEIRSDFPIVTEEPVIRGSVTLCTTSLLFPNPSGMGKYWMETPPPPLGISTLSQGPWGSCGPEELWCDGGMAKLEKLLVGRDWRDNEEVMAWGEKKKQRVVDEHDLPAFVDQLDKSETCILLDGVLPFL